jgi:hypothetical protein
MNYKPISFDEVCRKVTSNIAAGATSMHAKAIAGIAAGPVSAVPSDPDRPWVLRIRSKRENDGPENGWSIHPGLRFRDLRDANYVAQDLQALDKRLEIQIDRAG